MSSYADVYADVLRRRAPVYFQEDPRTIRVELSKRAEFRNSTIYEFDVVTNGSTRGVVVKVPFPESRRGRFEAHRASTELPRLVPVIDPADRLPFEFCALAEIQKRVLSLGDPRLGALRPYELHDDPQVMLMERRDEPLLSEFLPRIHRPEARKRAMTACRNSGLWLREFHELPDLPHTTRRHTSRQEFLDVTGRMFDSLEVPGAKHSAHRGRRESFEAIAKRCLPTDLPLCLTHADFAPHNVFVDGGGRVVVFDTRGVWRAPVYEDLARFLFSIRARPPSLSGAMGRSRAELLEPCAREFLLGYFEEDAIPEAAIGLFECQQIMARWAALRFWRGRSRGARRIAKAIRLRLWEPILARYFDSSLRRAGGGRESRMKS